MSSLFSKHLHLCFFKLKHQTTILSQPTPSPSPSPSPPSTPTTTFHFNATFTHSSLYDAATSSSALSTSKSTDDYFSDSSSAAVDHPPLPPPDFASIFASQRFFFSSPGNSNSIIESPDTRPCSHNNNNDNTKALIPSGGVRVPKYSLNPYMDFLRSMQEMINSRQVLDVTKDWDYLHELFLCYLALNPTHTHKYIVRAFTDLVVDLLSSSSSSSSSLSSMPPSPPVVKSTSCRKLKIRRHSSFSGQLV